MNNKILDKLRESTGRTTLINLAKNIGGSVPAVLASLLVMRRQGVVKAWNSGTPYMWQWSAV